MKVLERLCQTPDWDLIGRLSNWLCIDAPIQPDGAAEMLLRGTCQVRQASQAGAPAPKVLSRGTLVYMGLLLFRVRLI